MGEENVFFQVFKGLNVHCGIEGSFKMAEKKILANRLLVGVNSHELRQKDLLAICNRLNMPEKYQAAFMQYLPEANIIFFGFEEDGGRFTYKVYLEFWDKIRRELATKTNKTEPALLHLGYKWAAWDNTRGTEARYICYPLLSVERILQRLADIYVDHLDRTIFATARDIILFAAERAVDASFIYLEVGEENNPRRSFDINLYKAGLKVTDLALFLERACAHYSIPVELYVGLFDRIGDRIFGHLSGGIDRAGKDFLTVYYEMA